MHQTRLGVFRGLVIAFAALGFILLADVGRAAAEPEGSSPSAVESVLAGQTSEDALRTTAALPAWDETSDARRGGALIAALDAFEPSRAVDAQPQRTDEVEEYDPWESFNEPMFTFNYKLDQYVMKPVATGYDKVVPDQVKQSLDRAFTNLGMVKRAVNSALQLKFVGTAREVARFVINSTLGVAGFFDVAKNQFGIERSNEDMGQTLAVWGIENGPYLILPFLSPMTIRDGVGRAFDSLLDPLSYFAPLVARIAIKVTDTVNERSLNLEFFENVEAATVDLYSAVRNAYLQRRAKAIKE
jgi:phospholipid-binding lipoprotein MlaA